MIDIYHFHKHKLPGSRTPRGITMLKLNGSSSSQFPNGRTLGNFWLPWLEERQDINVVVNTKELLVDSFHGRLILNTSCSIELPVGYDSSCLQGSKSYWNHRVGPIYMLQYCESHFCVPSSHATLIRSKWRNCLNGQMLQLLFMWTFFSFQRRQCYHCKEYCHLAHPCGSTM